MPLVDDLTSFLFHLTKRGKKFILFICAPLLMIWQKGGEKFGVLYMHVCVIYMHIYFSISISAYMFCLCKKGRSILHLWIYVLFGLCIHWISLLFIAMHELRGASMKLNFNPYTYDSMSFVIIKKGEIVGRPSL